MFVPLLLLSASANGRRTITLNTGADMPFLNMGGTSQSVKAGDHWSNYSAFLELCHEKALTPCGIDTALTYTDETNEEISQAIKVCPLS